MHQTFQDLIAESLLVGTRCTHKWQIKRAEPCPARDGWHCSLRILFPASHCGEGPKLFGCWTPPYIYIYVYIYIYMKMFRILSIGKTQLIPGSSQRVIRSLPKPCNLKPESLRCLLCRLTWRRETFMLVGPCSGFHATLQGSTLFERAIYSDASHTANMLNWMNLFC